MTEAERLIDAAIVVKSRPRALLVGHDGPDPDGLRLNHALATVALTLRFDALSPATKLRAAVEEWDRARIIRECY